MASTKTNTGTIRGREAFIANIASRLGRQAVPAAAPDHPYRGAPDFHKQIQLTTTQKIEQFQSNWTALTGKVLVVSEAEASVRIGAWLQEVSKELGVTHAARWEHDGLVQLGIDQALQTAGVEVVPWRPINEASEPTTAPVVDTGGDNWSTRSALLRRTERCQLGIVWPDYAVANTGSLVLQCAPERGRSVSLLTSILFAIFREDQLVTRMGEAFTDITSRKKNASDYASSLNIITGPSRSADIENDLTIGIHGPGKVYAVIITK